MFTSIFVALIGTEAKVCQTSDRHHTNSQESKRSVRNGRFATQTGAEPMIMTPRATRAEGVGPHLCVMLVTGFVALDTDCLKLIALTRCTIVNLQHTCY